MPRNPNRNYAIDWIPDPKRTRADAAAAATAAVVAATTGTTATGALFGDAVGELLGPISVVGIHGQEISPPALAADVDDYAPAGAEALIWRLDLATFAITGIAAPAAPGEVHLLVALSAGSLAHDDVGSAAGNRLLIPGAANLALDVDDLALAVYDGTSLAWRIGPMVAPSLGLTPASYTITNPTTDRAFDADSITLDELADVVATLIADLGGT